MDRTLDRTPQLRVRSVQTAVFLSAWHQTVRSKEGNVRPVVFKERPDSVTRPVNASGHVRSFFDHFGALCIATRCHCSSIRLTRGHVRSSLESRSEFFFWLTCGAHVFCSPFRNRRARLLSHARTTRRCRFACQSLAPHRPFATTAPYPCCATASGACTTAASPPRTPSYLRAHHALAAVVSVRAATRARHHRTAIFLDSGLFL